MWFIASRPGSIVPCGVALGKDARKPPAVSSRLGRGRRASRERRSVNRLEPVPWHANYLLRRALAAQLRAAVAERLSGRSELRVLDVGCGGKPYAPLIEPYAAEYVGLDYRPGPNVDVVARAERLPFDAQRFDALLCSQVLEHSDDPSAVLREA